jgi:cell division protein ZipA
MSPLQWALLIFGVVAVLAVYLYSRRDRKAMDDWNPNQREEPLLAPKPRDRQLDIFNGENQQFDEFGVGKPRRISPTLDADAPPAEPGAAPARTPPAAARAPASEKIVSLLIAVRDGTPPVHGHLLHDALQAQGLEYGARQIYHRLHGGEAVFSVASLLKPGHLDPDAADSFATPGLTLFMILPGPVKPQDAIKDMLGTAERLAKALDAEVYDAKRKPLSPGAARNLQLEVEAWAVHNL